MEIDINTLIGVVVSLFIAGLIYILGINTGRPKLIISGGGGGGGGAPDSVRHSHIAIMNDPRFLGMRLDRQPAKIEQAFLRDKKSRDNYPLQSNWIESGSTSTSRLTSIEAGERKSLNLFAYVRGSGKYYVCGANVREIEPNTQCFSEPEKEFTLFLRDSIGREYRFDFIVTNKRNDIQVRSAITISQRLEMTKEAFSTLLRAFKPSKFG